MLKSRLDDEAGTLLQQFGDEPSAMWMYGRALWTFRREGDTAAARRSLRRALGVNRRVPKYLIGKSELPPTDPPAYAPSSEEEAMICARALGGVWQTTDRRRLVAAEKRPHHEEAAQAAKVLISDDYAC